MWIGAFFGSTKFCCLLSNWLLMFNFKFSMLYSFKQSVIMVVPFQRFYQYQVDEMSRKAEELMQEVNAL